MKRIEIGFASALICAVAACTAAATKSFIRDEDVGKLQADTKSTCMVGAQLGAPGTLMEVQLTTSGPELSTQGMSGGLLNAMADGFMFVNVPKGQFRVKMIHYQRNTGKKKNNFSSTYEMVETYFGEVHGVVAKIGDLPNELSGTCNGGFLWLGEYTGEEAGIFSSPKMKLRHLMSSGQVAEAMTNTKAKLAGSPWA